MTRKSTPERTKELARTLNVMDPASRERLLANVARENPELAIELRKQMFTFPDIVRIPDPHLQLLLREVPQSQLALALRNASDDLKAAIFRNLPARATQQLQEELQSLGKQRLSEVEAAQARIIELARCLEAEGRIMIGKSAAGD